jgi:hypothetical protein
VNREIVMLAPRMVDRKTSTRFAVSIGIRRGEFFQNPVRPQGLGERIIASQSRKFDPGIGDFLRRTDWPIPSEARAKAAVGEPSQAV